MTPSRTAALTTVFLTIAVAIAGCGAPSLSLTEQDKIATYQQAFDTTAVDGGEFSKTLDGVDYMIALCRKKADAKDGDNTIREDLEDDADTLRPYQPDLAARLEQAAHNDCK